jgi:hypothetical protein
VVDIDIIRELKPVVRRGPHSFSPKSSFPNCVFQSGGGQLFNFRFGLTPFRPDQVMAATASPELGQKIVFTPRPRQAEQLHAVIHTAIARPTFRPESIENGFPFSVDMAIQVHIPDIHLVPG